MEKKGKKYTLKIKGKEVEVNEEIYRAYIRPVQAEQRQKRRDWKCKLISGVSESGTVTRWTSIFGWALISISAIRLLYARQSVVS